MTLPAGLSFRTINANGMALRIAEMGSGPLVLLCHGWPESWYSWRHQLPALAAAGFHVVAPDMRGFGGSEAPPAVESYTLLHHAGDMTELVRALGESQAVIVGHDWGAPIAWTSALLRPDIFRAVAGLSVPYSPPEPLGVTEKMRRAGVRGYYMLYFEREGVAEKELQADVERSLRMFYWSLGGEANAAKRYVAVVPEGGGLLDTCSDCGDALPAWLTREDLAYYTAEYKRAGFRGGLNIYRDVDRTAALLAPWRGRPIEVPALYIGGTLDPVIAAPAARRTLEAMPHHLPLLWRCELLEGCGHWTQQERPDHVNRLLLDFLGSL
jgi:pimeloyl-ACP methyl ester carboxylesterase